MKRFKTAFLAVLLAVTNCAATGCTVWQEQPQDTAAQDDATLARAAASLTLPASTDTDLTLPTLDETLYPGITLTFRSDNTAALTHDGVVTRSDTDTDVTVTATLKLNGRALKKTFTVTVLALPAEPEPEPELTVERASLTVSAMSDSEACALTLIGRADPSARSVRLTIGYTDGEGNRKRDAFFNEAAVPAFSFTVELTKYAALGAPRTLSLSLSEALENGETHTEAAACQQPEAVVYGIRPDTAVPNRYALRTENGALTVLVESAAPADAADIPDEVKLLSDAARLAEIAQGMGLNEVTSDLSLPAAVTAGYGSAVKWSSDAPGTVSPTGAVTRPKLGADDAGAVLTATLSRGSLTRARRFTVTVKAKTSPEERFDYVQLYETYGDQTKLFDRLSGNLTFGSAVSGATIDVDNTVSYQELTGFGGMLSHGAAYQIYNSPHRQEILRQLFSDSGAHFRVVRLPIGSCDFPTYVGSVYDDSGRQTLRGTLEYFSLCDEKGPESDPLKNFDLSIDRQELIPLLQEMLRIDPDLVFVGTPWTAPAWMKTNGDLCGGWIKQEYESVYSDYLVRYIEEYAKYGIDIRYLSLQNEPNHAQSDYPTMNMHTDTQRRLLKLLGPKLEAKGLDTKLIILDHNTDMADYVRTVLNDADARKYVAGVGVHGYSGTLTQNNEMKTFTDSLRAAYPEIAFYFTEMTAGSTSTNFSNNLMWAAKNVVMDSVNCGMEMCAYFNFALDENGMPFLRQDWLNKGYHCTGLVELPSSGAAPLAKPELYALQHLSRFAQPIGGVPARRIQAETSDAALTVAATMQADGKIAVTVLNGASSAKNVTLRYAGRTVTRTLAAKSVSTFVFFE